VEGVKVLVAKRAHTILSCVCHAENISDLERYYELAESLDVDEVRFVPLKMLGRAMCGPFRPVSATRLLGEARSLFERRPEFLRFAAFSVLGTTCRRSIRRRSCGSGFRTFLIEADGSLYPCVNSPLPEFRFGNLRDEGFDFERTWRISSVLAEYRSRTSVDRENGGCAGCLVRYWCLGGCRGETYAALGRLEDRSPECEDLRAAIIGMFWTMAERPEIFREERGYC
jgi:radical SAM protein with 4Fe4S-binding SPASM domain